MSKMSKIINILVITLLALLIKTDIMILLWFVITTWQGLKLVIR